MDSIQDIKAFQVLDSRGNPTIKVIVRTETASGYALVPSGASTGSHEAAELRDGKKPYAGKGVESSVSIINKQIAKKLQGAQVSAQEHIDAMLLELDPSPNKATIGGNTMLGVSLAVCRAAAASQKKELFEYIAELYGNKQKLTTPVPLSNVINGGKHAGNYLKVQEFMLIPNKAGSFADATQMVSETYHVLKKIIAEKYGAVATNVGDEGGFAPPLRTPEEALNLLIDAISKSGYRRHVNIALDVAATETYSQQTYDIGAQFKASELAGYYGKLIDKYGIKSIEDPFAEDDLEAWQGFMQSTARKKKLQVVGDDLTVTSESRVKMAAEKKLCNAMILKVNQVGTLTEALKAAKAAEQAGWELIVSHRSGDTEDPFIADLAVGIGASQIKLGAPCRGERTAKYNRLLEIEELLSHRSFAGRWLRLRI